MPMTEDHFESFMRGVREAASTSLDAAALAGKEYAQTNMLQMPVRKSLYRKFKQEDGSHKIVRAKSRQRAVYTPSPPGGFPGRRRGNLFRSMIAAKSEPQTLVSAFGVYGGAKTGMHESLKLMGTKGYAGYLQFGTRRMKARPWATLTLEGAPLNQAFQDRFAAEMRRMAKR